jgi:hypothetical protein
LSATFDCFGSLMNEAAMVASTQAAHLPSLKSARFSLKLLAEAPGRAVLLHHVDVEGDGVLPGLGVDLRLPLHVEPLAAVGVDQRGQEGHVVAPARLAAQAHAVHAGLGVVGLVGKFLHLGPGGLVGKLHAHLVGQVLAVHEHRALAVERRGVQLAVGRQAVADGGQQVVDVVGGIGGDGLEPALLRPDGGLVQADGHHVELAALGGDVGGHALAQRAFLERDPLELDVGVGFFEEGGELLHLDHVAVVDGRDHEFGGGLGHDARADECEDEARFQKTLHVVS